jgi:hypothetical protein
VDWIWGATGPDDGRNARKRYHGAADRPR